MKVAVLVPTADPTQYPAETALRIARETTRDRDAIITPIASSGPGFSFALSVNRGFRESSDADAWVLPNDDCFMNPGWLDAMIDLAVNHYGGALTLSARDWVEWFIRVSIKDRAPFWGLTCR